MPSATVKSSSSTPVSCAVVICAEPRVLPAVMVIDDRVPWSPASDVFRVSVTGMVTLLDNAAESVAVTATKEPSGTGFGEAERVTVVGSDRDTVTCWLSVKDRLALDQIHPPFVTPSPVWNTTASPLKNRLPPTFRYSGLLGMALSNPILRPSVEL